MSEPSKLEQALDLMVSVTRDETPTEVTMHATIKVDNPNGKTVFEVGDEIRALLPEGITSWTVSGVRPATFDEKLAFLATGGRDSCNGHLLAPIRKPVMEPCWKIAYFDKLRSEADTRALEQWETVRNSDFPNGLVHDETCTTCHGTGERRTEVVTGYQCLACDMQHEDRSGFYTTSCILNYGITKGIIEDWRDEHLNGEHGERFGFRVPGCPLCAADNMKRKAEARKVDA